MSQSPVGVASDSVDPYAVFRLGAYRSFVGARIFFSVSLQMQSTAVAWQIYERFGTTMALAYVGLLQVLPVIFFALPAGHVADHFDRRKVLSGALALVLLSSLGLTLLTVKSWSSYGIYCLVVLSGLARVFAAPALASLLPNLIPRKHWGDAAKWNSSIFELSSILGPTLAGALIGLTGGTTAVYVVSSLLSGTCLFLIGGLPVPTNAVNRPAVTLREFFEGLRFMWRAKLMLAAASLDLLAVFFGGAIALLPVVAKDILHVGPHGFGWLRAAPSIGAVSMAILSAHLPPWKRAGRVLFGAFIGFGLATIVFGLSRNFWLSMAMLVLLGVFDNLNVVIRQTLIQYITPDALRGRVSAINFIFIGCSNELGGFESGLTAELFGTVPAIVGGGVGTLLVVALVMKLAPQLRRLGPLHEVKPAG